MSPKLRRKNNRNKTRSSRPSFAAPPAAFTLTNVYEKRGGR